MVLLFLGKIPKEKLPSVPEQLGSCKALDPVLFAETEFRELFHRENVASLFKHATASWRF